jgi:SAM-dependent methyltransferase
MNNIENKKTDWDTYYSTRKHYLSLPRWITLQFILSFIKRFVIKLDSIIELGGGDSCFMGAMLKKFKNIKYYIFDNSEISIDKSTKNNINNRNIIPILADVLSEPVDIRSDFVYSVGLIEHFSVEDTAKCIKYHFDMVNNDGIVLITFPTPTFLYKIMKRIAIIAGVWVFYDERPLLKEEVISEIKKYGVVLDYKTNWWIGLTQVIIVAKKTIY